jgi:hypothetical protein
VAFFASPLADRLLLPLLLYLAAAFSHEALARLLERSRASHADPSGVTAALIQARMAEAAAEAGGQRLALSQPYCETLLAHASARNPQQDKCVRACVRAWVTAASSIACRALRWARHAAGAPRLARAPLLLPLRMQALLRGPVRPAGRCCGRGARAHRGRRQWRRQQAARD